MLESAGSVVVQEVVKVLMARLLSRRKPAINESEPHGYAVEVGERIRTLREDLLGFSKRRMCELLGLNSVTLLERYESGIEEFPLSLTRRVEELFFLNADFLDGGTVSVFRNFYLCSDECAKYLGEGYEPVLICNPKERSELFCYVTFERNTVGFRELHVGSLLSSFVSSGGGRLNIQCLINAMLDANLPAARAKIYKVSEMAWDAAKFDCYHLNTADLSRRVTDFECCDVWGRWYAESLESRQRWIDT
ncbi:helix-turn-helix domain-containing protein [Pseudomonas putida]|uniref:Helix-turn-helix transcriptional regulator n=1 Tax=Pseudomonas putida TaxID=303 RepID=A0AAW4BPA1_PSEPU|nr:helix-turn-helix transcriptional regulator [Pseudomonas putida]MBF8700293.1 helix-turn-helix transcriptional regulator [Pseudomonas putida]MBF8735002.1 helix-turn-helix transcriptional regulator [Pseudomonas putida]